MHGWVVWGGEGVTVCMESRHKEFPFKNSCQSLHKPPRLLLLCWILLLVNINFLVCFLCRPVKSLP